MPGAATQPPGCLFQLNTGSATTQYTKDKDPNKEHPLFARGHSAVVLGCHSSKITCVSDEAIKVFSFDFDEDDYELLIQSGLKTLQDKEHLYGANEL